MENYSQKGWYRWQKLGTCSVRIGTHGCFITSLANLADTSITNPRGNVSVANPSIVDWKATTDGLYAKGCLVVSKAFAKMLGLEYNGRSTKQPKYNCIGETNYYNRQGIPQHFFVVFADGDILDPLDLFPKKKTNKYARHMVSYRLFRNTKNDCSEQLEKVQKYQEKLEDAQKDYINCLNK